VVVVAQELLGKMLFHAVGGVLTGGIIVESEALCRGDRHGRSHAFGNSVPPRTEVSVFRWRDGLWFTCVMAFTRSSRGDHKKDVPDAVLIRAIKPVGGMETMLRRSGKKMPLQKDQGTGPGKLARLLGFISAIPAWTLQKDCRLIG